MSGEVPLARLPRAGHTRPIPIQAGSINGDDGLEQSESRSTDETDGGLSSKLAYAPGEHGDSDEMAMAMGTLSPTFSASSYFEVITDAEVQIAPALANTRKFNDEDLASAFDFVKMDIPEDVLAEAPLPNPNALHEMEEMAKQIAGNLHYMLGTSTASLHAISGKCRVCVEAYGAAVDDIGVNVDETMEMMQQLGVHCDTISQNMKYVYFLADQLKSIKATLAVFEKMVK